MYEDDDYIFRNAHRGTVKLLQINSRLSPFGIVLPSRNKSSSAKQNTEEYALFFLSCHNMYMHM